MQAPDLRAILCAAGVVLFFDLCASAEPPLIESIRKVPLSSLPGKVALNADGSVLATASDKRLEIRDLKAGDEAAEPVRIEGENPIVDIDFSADSEKIAASDGTVIVSVFDRKTGERIQQLHRRDAPGYLRSDPQRDIAFFPDGKQLISAGSKLRIYLSNLETGEWDHIQFTKFPETSTPVVSPDGRLLALVGAEHPRELSGQVSLYRVHHGLARQWTRWHEYPGAGAVRGAGFSADGGRLVSWGAGDGARIWDTATGDLIAHLENDSGGPWVGAAFLKSGTHLAVVTPDAIQIRSLEITPREGVVAELLHPEKGTFQGAAFSADGSVIATIGKVEHAVAIWDLKE